MDLELFIGIGRLKSTLLAADGQRVEGERGKCNKILNKKAIFEMKITLYNHRLVK